MRTASQSLCRHLVDGAVLDDPGVIDQDVEAAELFDGQIDDSLSAFLLGHAVIAGYGGASRVYDAPDDCVGSVVRGANAVSRRTYVVNDDFSSAGCQGNGMGASQTVP